MNTSKLNPQQAGTKEVFTFSPKLFTNGPDHQPDGETQESHRIYVAIRAIDKNSLKSVISNIAQASLFISPNSAPILTRDHLILKGVLTAMGSIGIICLTIVVTHCTLNRKKRADKKENGTKLIWANVQGTFLLRYKTHGLCALEKHTNKVKLTSELLNMLWVFV